uniref:Uncharacterized protein n=1 Tax=Meloidogyne incognita TaxID=6306 RepID=A0A914L7W9_MELIC
MSNHSYYRRSGCPSCESEMRRLCDTCLYSWIYLQLEELCSLDFQKNKNIRKQFKNLFKSGYLVNPEIPDMKRVVLFISDLSCLTLV